MKKLLLILLCLPMIGLSQSIDDLSRMNKKELRIARNTVFAKHGREFKSPDLKQYFNSRVWYTVNPSYTDAMLTNNDEALISAIKVWESSESKYVGEYKGGKRNGQGTQTDLTALLFQLIDIKEVRNVLENDEWATNSINKQEDEYGTSFNEFKLSKYIDLSEDNSTNTEETVEIKAQEQIDNAVIPNLPATPIAEEVVAVTTRQNTTFRYYFTIKEYSSSSNIIILKLYNKAFFNQFKQIIINSAYKKISQDVEHNTIETSYKKNPLQITFKEELNKHYQITLFNNVDKQKMEEKHALRDDLDDIIAEHDDVLDEYGTLNKQLHEKDAVIQDQISEIRNLIRTKSDLTDVRKKIAVLKDISKRYLANIDSLLVVNEALAFEKDSVVEVNKDINWKKYKQNKQNYYLSEKVSKGSMLEVLDEDLGIGEDGTTYQLGDRKAEFNAKPIYNIQVEGKVVVAITVDQLGNVIYANPGIKGSTTLNKELLQRAKKAALATKFEPKQSAPTNQQGEIIYYFQLY